MTRPCQRRKVRNPGRKTSRRTNRSVVKKTVAYDPTVGRFWDKQKTIQQNFATVGLASRVNADLQQSAVRARLDAWEAERFETLVEEGEKQMKIDEEKGEVATLFKPIQNQEDLFAKLDRLFDEVSTKSAEDESVKTVVTRELEERSKQVRPKAPERLSEFEREYISLLVTKYGDDYSKMALDHKINSRQLTARELQKMALKL